MTVDRPVVRRRSAVVFVSTAEAQRAQSSDEDYLAQSMS